MPLPLIQFALTNIVPCSAIFQAGGLIVVVVEVTRKSFLASLVPVIVDAILNEHQVVADIVAFVSHGDFPRSRLGEKQRGKVLASWVTRKLRTIAQFSIRDMDDNPFAEMPQHRMSRSSKPGSMMGTSTRRSTMNPESDMYAVPRSPAAVVLEETIKVPHESYHDLPPQGTLPELDNRTDHAASATPVPGSSSAVPYVKEPQSASFTPEDDYNFQSGEPAQNSRDFRFSFDMASTPIESLPQDSAFSGAERPTTGHDSYLSQQSALHSGGVGVARPMHNNLQRPRTQDSGIIDDWPQEALMYESALGPEDGQDAHRQHGSLNSTTQHLYEGNGYE